MNRYLLISICFAFLGCGNGVTMESSLSQKFDTLGSVKNTIPENSLFILDSYKKSSIETPVSISFSKAIIPNFVTDGIIIMSVLDLTLLFEKFSALTDDTLASHSIDSANTILDLIDDIEAESKDESETVSLPIDGELTITTTKTSEIVFIPNEPFKFNTRYLVLIRGLLDLNYEPILPYIGMFETEDNGDSFNESPVTDPEIMEPTPGPTEEPDVSFNANDLIINEILSDPPDDTEGDANQDGVRDSYDDEFIEIINTTENSLPLNGVAIRVGTSIRHTFLESDTILGNGCIVVFGGGTPPSQIGNSTVYVSNSSLKLTNTGTTITIEKNGEPISSTIYNDTASNQSITRYPDITGDFIPHSEISGNDIVRLFSPGSKTDGSDF